MTPQQFPDADHLLGPRSPGDAHIREVREVFVPERGKYLVLGTSEIAGAFQGEMGLRPYAEPRDDGMQVIERPLLCRVFGVSFPVYPASPEFPPGVDANDRGLPAVYGNELVPFHSHHRDPVVPTVDAQEGRVPLFQKLDELAFRPERILAAYDLHLAVTGLRGPGELDLVSPGPPVCPGDVRNLVFVHYSAQHDKRILQGKRSALPFVRLRIQSHRRGKFQIERSPGKKTVAPAGTT